MYQYKFSVFTPTYNRAHTIHRVYESLCKQTFRDFEWLIVDDGSNDGTKKLVEKWMSEADFPIRYIWQENKGKHVAFNHGVAAAKGELFLTADSDDGFIANSLERFNYHWESISENNKAKFVGVVAHCMYQDGKLAGNMFPSSPLDSDAEEIFYRYKLKGEKWGFQRTDVLKEFPFPEPKEMKFVSEGYVWFRIAKKYKTRFVNEILRIYHQDAGNQLVKRPACKIAPARIFYVDNINISINWFWYAPYRFWKTAVQYVRFSILSKDSIYLQLHRLKGALPKLLWFLAIVPGVILATRDLVQNRKENNV